MGSDLSLTNTQGLSALAGAAALGYAGYRFGGKHEKLAAAVGALVGGFAGKEVGARIEASRAPAKVAASAEWNFLTSPDTLGAILGAATLGYLGHRYGGNHALLASLGGVLAGGYVGGTLGKKVGA